MVTKAQTEITEWIVQVSFSGARPAGCDCALRWVIAMARGAVGGTDLQTASPASPATCTDLHTTYITPVQQALYSKLPPPALPGSLQSSEYSAHYTLGLPSSSLCLLWSDFTHWYQWPTILHKINLRLFQIFKVLGQSVAQCMQCHRRCC